MQAEKISDLNGKVINRRVLDTDVPALESTVVATGKYKDVEVTETITFVVNPQSNDLLNAVGRGIIIANKDGEMATYKGEGVGVYNTSDRYTVWKGTLFFRSTSTAKLAFLNNLVGVFEAKIDNDQNFSGQTYEWK
jgi:hypothetical protein